MNNDWVPSVLDVWHDHLDDRWATLEQLGREAWFFREGELAPDDLPGDAWEVFWKQLSARKDLVQDRDARELVVYQVLELVLQGDVLEKTIHIEGKPVDFYRPNR